MYHNICVTSLKINSFQWLIKCTTSNVCSTLLIISWQQHPNIILSPKCYHQMLTCISSFSLQCKIKSTMCLAITQEQTGHKILKTYQLDHWTQNFSQFMELKRTRIFSHEKWNFSCLCFFTWNKRQFRSQISHTWVGFNWLKNLATIHKNKTKRTTRKINK